MGAKMNVPTFQIYVLSEDEPYEGAVVSPDKLSYAKDLPDIDQVILNHQALLVYDKKWNYIPFHQIKRINKGKHRFDLPWPLV